MNTPATTDIMIVIRARDAFATELSEPPPVSLRGGNDIDSYDTPAPFDAEVDTPTDEYLQRYAYWALPHLDARSWRHYLPWLIDHTLRHRDDRSMALEALVQSLRPPDRFPPRLGSLDSEQEVAV